RYRDYRSAAGVLVCSFSVSQKNLFAVVSMYLFSGVRPSSGAAASQSAAKPKTSEVQGLLELAAPEDVLTPLRSLAEIALLFFCINGFAATGSDEDRPQFLGPRANGTSTETGLLDKWPTNGPPLLWEKKIGTGYSAPSVRGDSLVLHHRIGDEEIIECLQSATGKPTWRYAYPSHFIDPYGYNNGPRGTPLLTENCCYTLVAQGKLVWPD